MRIAWQFSTALAGVATLASGALAAGGHTGGPDAAFYWKAINFAILVFLVVYFGRKYIVRFFQNRSSRIEEELNAARRAQAEAEQKARDYEQKYAALKDEVVALAERSRQVAEEEKQKILEEARALSARMVENARNRISMEFERTARDIRSDMIDQAFERAQSELQTSVSAANNEELVQEFKRHLKGGAK